MAKGSFVFYNSIYESIEVLTDDIAKLDAAMGAVVRYGVHGEQYTGDDPIIKCAMLQAVPLIESNKAKTNSGGTGAPVGNRNASKTNHRLEKTNHRLEKNKPIPYQNNIFDVEKEKKDEKENSPHTPYKEKEEKEKKVEIEEKDTLKCVRKEKTPMQRFVPPTVEEVAAYVKAKGYDVDAEAFVAFYESKGWKVGYQPMKSWKAATVTWMKKQRADGKVDRLEERKRTLVQDDSLLGRVNKWFIANAPYITGHFETLLTVEQYNFLLNKYGKDRLTDTIMDLENRHDMCDKYNNLNTTLINWLENGKQ